MTRPRGRPAKGGGVTRQEILTTALILLDEGGGQGLTMRALASRLDVTPMSLYHHVQDRSGLLLALSDRIYSEVLEGIDNLADQREEVRALLMRYHAAVGLHPQLTLAIFSEPQAFSGVTSKITDWLTLMLQTFTREPVLWRNVLIDHLHGSGLALIAAKGDQHKTEAMQEQYRCSLDCLLELLVV